MVETSGGAKKPSGKQAKAREAAINKAANKLAKAKANEAKEAKKAKKNYCVSGSSIGFDGGNYNSSAPLDAAKKAISKMFAKIKDDKAYAKHKKVKSIKFILRSKSKSKKDIKTFAYTGVQEKLDTPKKIMIAGKEIIYKYKYIVKATKLSAPEVKKMTGGFLDEAIDLPPDSEDDE